MDHDNEPTIRDLIVLIRRGLLIAIVLAAAAAAVTYYFTSTLAPSYEAGATLLVSSQDPNQRDFGVTLVTAPPLDSPTYLTAIRSRQVLGDALRFARGSDPTQLDVDALAAAVTVRADDARTSSIIRVVVRDDVPGEARDLANAVAAAAVRWDEARATRSLETIIDSLEAQIASIDDEIQTAAANAPIDGLTRNRAELQLQLSSARALRTAAVGRLELLERAETPRAPVAPRPVRSAAIAGMFAVLLTYGLLLLRVALDTRLRDPEDLARVTEVPVLSEFPKVAGRRALPREAASYLRTAVAFATSQVHPKIILVTSTGPNHGKSSVSIALAESFARQSFKTLLIDADLRKPVLGREFALYAKDHPSLRDALIGGVNAVTVCSLPGTDAELNLIPSFEPAPNPTELLANKMHVLIERLRHEYDVIIIDSAPILPVADTLVIAPDVTGVVFAVSMPDADRRQVRNAIGLLRRVGVRIFGTVATNVRTGGRMASAAGYGYGYGYGYGAGYGAGTEAPQTGITKTSVREVKPLVDR